MLSTSRVAAVVAAIALALPLTAGAQRTPAMPAMSSNLTLTAVDGIRVGHFTLSERPTGCTVIVADGDGAVVVPAALLDEVLESALEQERLEGWIMREVEAGVPLPGLYPSNEATKARYEAWRSTQPRK